MASGVLGVLFLLLRLLIKRSAEKSLESTMKREEDSSDASKEAAAYRRETLLPIIRRVMTTFGTAGCLGYRSQRTTQDYVSSIEYVVGRLAHLGVDVNMSAMPVAQRAALINEILVQIRTHFGLANRSGWTKACSPDFSPDQLWSHADDIAAAVRSRLGRHAGMPAADGGHAMMAAGSSAGAAATTRFVRVQAAPTAEMAVIASPSGTQRVAGTGTDTRW